MSVEVEFDVVNAERASARPSDRTDFVSAFGLSKTTTAKNAL
jgi:hypothetical protein